MGEPVQYWSAYGLANASLWERDSIPAVIRMGGEQRGDRRREILPRGDAKGCRQSGGFYENGSPRGDRSTVWGCW